MVHVRHTPVHARIGVEHAQPVSSPPATEPNAPPRAGASTPSPAFQRGSTRSTEELTPAAGTRASLPLGRWSLAVPSDGMPSAVPAQQAAFKRMLQSGVPGRAALVEAAVAKRTTSTHAYYRGIADARTAWLAKELPASRYRGNAGFVLSSGDMHLYQPTTVRHPEHGAMMGVGDSDRVGVGPYEWDLRSLLTSVELEGRVHGFSAAQRTQAMQQLLGAYTAAIHDAAAARHGARDAAKELRAVEDHAPRVFKPYLDAASDASRKTWMAAQVDKGDPPRLVRVPGKLEDLPGPGADDVRRALQDALPRYVAQLPAEARARFKGLQVVDVALPFQGNGSLGYGRYRVLLAPPHGGKSADRVILEFKEQLPSALGKYVDQGRTEAQFGKDQATRAVSLFRAGTGKNTAADWGHVTLPAGCGVESRDFTVKEARADEQGVDLAKAGPREFTAMAEAQGRLLAAFQALGGVNGAASQLGTAADIQADLNARPDFVAENLAGARRLADHIEADAAAFKRATAA